jgi:hypothetical protein
MCLLYFYRIHVQKCNTKKYFYDIMKYKKMNDGIFNFYVSMVNISYGVFTSVKKVVYMRLGFL